MAELAEKPGENHQKDRGKWQKLALFRRPKAPFLPIPSPPRPIANLESARPGVGRDGCREPVADPPILRWSAIFADFGMS
jgi:hypothetical protein